MKKLLLTDGNSMLFRAYFATAYSGARLTSSNGTPTNAVFGFVSMMQKAIELMQPDAILVAFDAGKHTFRHELYPDYKGGRKPTPEDLIPQFSLVREYCDSYKIKWIEMQDIEADDLIGTTSKKFPDVETTILTSDHDLLQLVDPTTSVLLMKKGITDMEVMTVEKMKEEMGIEPKQIIDLKGLMGDASDNYPGIPGVGEKTAYKLLAQYGNVEEVLAHEDEIKGALGKKVKEGHDSALLSKALATIKTDVDLPFTYEDLEFHPDYETLVKFLKSLDMKSMAAKFEGMSLPKDEPVVPAAEEAEKHMERVQKIPASFLQKDCFVFIDDDRGNYLSASIHGFALCSQDEAYYISLPDAKEDPALLAYFKQEIPHKTGYDIKRNMHLLKNEGMEISFYDDVMITASLKDSTLTSTEKIAENFGLVNTVQYEDVYGKTNKPILFVDEELQTRYGCESCYNIALLYEKTYPSVIEEGMESLYRDIEMPLTRILYDMENEGIRCDIQVLDHIAQETYEKIQTEAQKIYQLAGKEFNLNSPKQLGEVLYDDLKLPSGKKRSTSAEKLEGLSGIHPIIDSILVYRKLQKIYSTYAEGLKKYIFNDGKIHTIYNQCATQTGRLSSSEPNLQNISVRDEQGKVIRKAFKPEKGCVLMSCDYHQIELRMLAHMADEKGLIEAFRSGVDAHTKTAMDIFEVDRDEVTPEMRRKAKTVNFGVVYGISEFGLAKQLGVSRFEAKDYIDTYNQKFPGISKYMDQVVEECKKTGYVTTILGRRREIPEIRDKNHNIREFGKRAAMNAPIQGSAADLIKIAMIRIDRAMKEKHVKSKMILQVHDELIFNVETDEIDIMKQIIEEGMNHAMELKVPLTSECAMGQDWYEAK